MEGCDGSDRGAVDEDDARLLDTLVGQALDDLEAERLDVPQALRTVARIALDLGRARSRPR